MKKSLLIHWLEEELKKARYQRDIYQRDADKDPIAYNSKVTYWQGRMDALESVYLQVTAHPFAGKL